MKVLELVEELKTFNPEASVGVVLDSNKDVVMDIKGTIYECDIEKTPSKGTCDNVNIIAYKRSIEPVGEDIVSKTEEQLSLDLEEGV